MGRLSGSHDSGFEKMIVKHSAKVFVALALVVSTSILVPHQTKACGPFFTDAIFFYTKHPDFPLERFAGGQLGVLQPGYARSYLVAAYRNLIGADLSAGEVNALKTLWDDRLNYSWEFHDQEWIKAWVDARSKVPGVAAPTEIRAFRNREKPNQYESYVNCQEDAFATARATLAERIRHFGAGSAAVRDWVAAQDAVFANCGGGRQIPEAARSDHDALIRADRAYQIAAANFYTGSFDDARQQFDAIARDQSSPWRTTAAYLAARAMLRKGSFAEKDEEKRPTLTEAESRLKSVLADKSATSIHRSSARLLNLVRLRLYPEDQLHEIAHTIARKDASADFRQAVWDYTVLLDKFLGDDDEVNSQTLPAGLSSDDLTDWVVTFQDKSGKASTHALDRWEKTQALPWLLASMTKAKAQQAGIDTLLNAANRVDPASPAYASVAYHTVRLLIETNRIDEARRTLDRVLGANRSRLPASAVNLFLNQRMTVAQNLSEVLQSAQRVPAGFSSDIDGREIPDDDTQNKTDLLFDPVSADVLNHALPVAILHEAASGAKLAPHLRRDVAQAAFMRAALIDDRVTAAQAATVLGAAQPELKVLLSAYTRAGTPEARRFAAAYLSLKFPGLRPYVTAGIGRGTSVKEIDSYRDNWWCIEAPYSLSAPGSQGEGGDGEKTNVKRPPLAAFLKPSQSTVAQELAKLRSLGTAPNHLCRIAIDWTNRNPGDPRAPEALHLAVKSTRYGCTDKDTGRWSKAAFDLIHRRYPNSSWAQETKYWFKG